MSDIEFKAIVLLYEESIKTGSSQRGFYRALIEEELKRRALIK